MSPRPRQNPAWRVGACRPPFLRLGQERAWCWAGWHARTCPRSFPRPGVGLVGTFNPVLAASPARGRTPLGVPGAEGTFAAVPSASDKSPSAPSERAPSDKSSNALADIVDGGGQGTESWLRQVGMETCCECNQNHTMQNAAD
jgi:hypothetical protein